MPFFNSLQCGAAIRLLYYFERECWPGLLGGWVGRLVGWAAGRLLSLVVVHCGGLCSKPPLFAAIKVKARAKWKPASEHRRCLFSINVCMLMRELPFECRPLLIKEPPFAAPAGIPRRFTSQRVLLRQMSQRG